ncbi:MAG: hypothetical protein WCI73_00715 [Phycisphaerae bacterium]
MMTTGNHLKQQNLAAAVTSDSRFVEILGDVSNQVRATAVVVDCVRKGYAPLGYGLADFSILRHEGLFHLFHIPRVPGGSCIAPAHEHWLAHATSADLDVWVTQNPVLWAEPAHDYESAHVWAPFVMAAEKRHLMYYAGLSGETSQVLCGAVCSDSALNLWKRLDGNPITPFAGFDWHWRNPYGHCRHARDPHVIHVGSHYLMVYTAMHQNGCPCVGGLISTDLERWDDIGPVLYRPSPPAVWWPESVNIQPLEDGRWVMIVSVSPGLDYYVATDPHQWHGLTPQRINYVGRDRDALVAPEVVGRSDRTGRWLLAFFESNQNRMFLGILDIHSQPWSIRRLEDPRELAEWIAL